jgi:hypothetical protein
MRLFDYAAWKAGKLCLEPAIDRAAMFGRMKDSRIIGDIISPAIDEDEWEAWRD